MKKRIIILAAIAGLVSALAGCGESAATQKEQPNPIPDTQTAAGGETEEAVDTERAETEATTSEVATSEAIETMEDERLSEILREAADLPQGVSGVTLKQAQIAGEIAEVAAERAYTEEAVAALRKIFRKEYEALDAESRENLDRNVTEGILPYLDSAIANDRYEEVKGIFEDAGAAEQLESARKAPGIAESYDAIKTAYLTMNDNGEE